MIFDPPSQALDFLRAGGTVTLKEWQELSPADRLALRVARETLAETPRIESQIQAEGDQLEGAVAEVARRFVK